MMGFEEFREQVMVQLPNFLPSGIEVEIGPTEIVKNNGRKKQGIYVLRSGSNIGPNIYLNDYYLQYSIHERSMQEILAEISKISMERMVMGQMDTSRLTDYSKVRERLYCALVNKENNDEYLKDKPYTQVEDLAVTYQVFVGEGTSETATTTVTDQMMEEFGIDKETLHRDAMENTQRMFPTELVNLVDLLSPLKELEGLIDLGEMQELLRTGPQAYAVTNRKGTQGAAGILNPAVMDQIAERIGENIYVIPSSVHEFILFPKRPNMDYHAVEEWICEINRGMLYPEEILSEHAYGIDFKEHRLYRCDLEEQRIKERELETASEKEKADPESGIEKKAVRRKPEQRGPKM